ncbi:MAG: carbohydrate ABC transporter permease [Clostridia bacterium]|nr:carbohydrate ABC transporter permease [Clostridia bacterium]
MPEAQVTRKGVLVAERKKPKISGVKVLVYLVLSIWAVTTIAPLLWVINNSLKPTSDIIINSVALPKSLDFTNFSTLSGYDMNIFKGFLNSAIISGSVVLFVSLIGGLASFVIARFNFKYSKQIRSYFVVSMLVPVFAVLIPDMLILQNIGLNESYLGVIVPQTAGFLNFAVLMMTGFMASLPVELEEAAILDGCGVGKIFFKIIIPLCKPVFATVGIMVFLWSYNDLIMPMVFLPNKLAPVTLIISKVSSIAGVNYGAMMAALVLTITPIILLYVVSQEYVIKGLTAGAVKG